MIEQLEEVYFLTLIKTIEGALAVEDSSTPPLVRVKRALGVDSLLINEDTLLLYPLYPLVVWVTEKEFTVYKPEVTELVKRYNYKLS